MGRSFQGYLLIVVMGFSVSANLATVLAGSSAAGHACPPGCCGRADCPMHRHGGQTPMKCPMSSMGGHHKMEMSCTCSMSQPDAPVIPASLFELRYDLPRAQGLLMPALAAYRPAELVPASLEGFSTPPDQPPRALQF
jgi:hypothetical protein